jgi:hypothetical protein
MPVVKASVHGLTMYGAGHDTYWDFSCKPDLRSRQEGCWRQGENSTRKITSACHLVMETKGKDFKFIFLGK